MEKRFLNFITALAILTSIAGTVHAQYKQKSPADILREAQERQHAIDQAGAEFRRNANEILEQQRRQQSREREDRESSRRAEQQERERLNQEEQREREAQRRAEDQEKRNADFQKQIQNNFNQQQENTRLQQEQAQQTLRGTPPNANTDSAGKNGFTQSPLPVVNTGSTADIYRQTANQYRWAAKEYRTKGEYEKANQWLNEAAKYDKMVENLDSKSRPVVMDAKTTPRTPPPTAAQLAKPDQKPAENKCAKCGYVDHPMSARTRCPRCGS
jgi:hypothetical protein